MSVFLERQALTVKNERGLSFYEDDYLRFEIEYKSFLNWWEKNQQRFNNLSFRIDSQTNLFLDQLNNVNLELALSQLRMDLYGYYLEYIRQEGIIPFTLKFNFSGQIVGEFYGDKPITEIVDKREREGEVYNAMVDLEKKLKFLKEDEIIFRISPSGWTGLGYDYTETQAQLLWRDKDRFRGLTLRTQIELKEILSLISEFGVEIPSEVNDEKEIIKWVTSLNITLPYSFWEIIQFLKEKFDNRDHQGKNLNAQVSDWLEKDSDFRYFDDIAGLVNFLQTKIKDLVSKAYFDEEIREQLSRLISFVLMGMAGANMGMEVIDDSIQVRALSSDMRFLPPYVYDSVFNHLQSLPGCAGGGGQSNEFVLTSFGTRTVLENDKYGLREFECPHCSKKVLRPKDKLLEKCPHCGGDVRC